MKPVLVACALVACGPKPSSVTPSNAAAPGGEIVLYRDRALVRQRVDFEVPPGGYATVRATIAAGIDVDDIVIVERDRFTIRELHVPQDPPVAHPVDDEADEPEEPPAKVKQVEIVVAAPRAGRYALHLAYLTERLGWDVAYTMTTTPMRDHATLRGALAIRNATGIPLSHVDVHLVDAELDASIKRSAELLATSYAGAEPATSPAAVPHDLGRLDLVDGETRVELLPDARPQRMRSVLVYDPIGTTLDRVSAAPVRDIALGAGPSPTRVSESFEIARDVHAMAGLPGGPVRLLERRTDGALAVLGEARLFEASTRVAETDTIAIGTAEGVVGHRERRDYTYDTIRKRLVEEFVISIDNTRPRPVEVVVREHLYRSHTWAIADPIMSQRPVKEGPQQFSMRAIVPPKSQRKLFYVVVYPWD